MFHKVPHTFMQQFLMGIPEMQRFPLRLQAISASKFEGSPNRFEGHRLTPSAIKKPHRPPLCRGRRAVVLDPHQVGSARCAPPPGSPNITKRDAGVMLCVRRPSCGVQLLSASFYPVHLPHNVADMIDQGRLVPSFLSHLEIIMRTGIIFTVHKHSAHCNYGLTVPQEKNTFLLPILAPDIRLQ